MCGISVLLDPAAGGGVRERLRRLHAPIRHRGPDGEGFLAVDRAGRPTRGESVDALPFAGTVLAAAFRRLRILDLSPAAAQPMSSPDGAHWILFNGEVYNYRPLRAELEARGRRFRSSGDTEVVLAAFEAWGEEAFARLDGMWALVVADLRRRRLLFSRDRFGIKPLYWALDGGALLLASEARQIVAARGERPRAHAPLVQRYLRGSRYPCFDESFFAGVQPVPAATWASVPLDGPPSAPRFERYWDLAAFAAPEKGARPYADALEHFRTLLQDAVATHLQSDARLGCLLSGGLDSSTVTALAAPLARAAGQACPTFSFGLPGDASSELPLALEVARAHGLPNHQAGLDAAWLRAQAGPAVRALEEPPLALPALAQYRIYALCRQHDTTVILDGQGADEVLGGYPYHQRLLLADRLRRGRARGFARELGAIARRARVARLRLLGALVLPSLRARLRPEPAWLAPWTKDAGEGAREAAARADRGRDPALVNRQLYWDVKWGNVRVVLGHTDKSAMAHSIEARVPFFDRRLVEAAFSLPDDYKVGDGQTKRILRDAARRVVPPAVTERSDRLGFGLPEAALLRETATHLHEVIASSGLRATPWVEPRALDALLERHRRGDDTEARAVWRLFALATWAREFGAALD
jgi:asparagine synthase (glutamine-hydrolysing)